MLHEVLYDHTTSYNNIKRCDMSQSKHRYKDQTLSIGYLTVKYFIIYTIGPKYSHLRKCETHTHGHII